MNTRYRAAITAAVITFAGLGALAHTGATGVVKERMDAMDAMGDAVKSVGAMFRGEARYDAAAVREAAETIRSQSGSAMIELFPEGSNEDPSEAKDAIWRNWETFSALALQLEVMAEGLARAADSGPGGRALPSEKMMGNAGNMMGGAGGMMGGGGMMGSSAPMMDADHLAEMPAEAVFTMMSQTCSACHTRFRAEED